MVLELIVKDETQAPSGSLSDWRIVKATSHSVQGALCLRRQLHTTVLIFGTLVRLFARYASMSSQLDKN